MSVDQEPTERLHAVLVTFERPRELATMLRVLAEGTQRVDSLVIVDNSRVPEGEPDGAADAAHHVILIETHENLGPAGGIALGMDRILATASDDDWILVLDDDDPPPTPESLASLRHFAHACVDDDPAVGGVGSNGGRFDPKTGEIRRVPDAELRGPVDVDYLPGGALPLYRARAVRDVGTPMAELFFGYDDLEFGLRLRAAGYRLVAHGDIWRDNRERTARLGLGTSLRSTRATNSGWRLYYSRRNLIAILRLHSLRWPAVRASAIALAKPLFELRDGHELADGLRLSVRAVVDGWTGRLGRTLEPPSPLMLGAGTHRPPLPGSDRRFAIIIPAYNNAETLRRCLASIPASGEIGVETVVVDDASTDESEGLYEDLQTAGVSILRNARNCGPAYSRNRGAATTSGRWLVFLDSDDELLAGGLVALHDAIAPDVGLVCATHTDADPSDPERQFFAGTFAVRRDVFEAIDGYDPVLRFAENTDLLWRLTAELRRRTLHIADVTTPIVRLHSIGRSRDYDEARLSAAKRILEKHRDDMVSSRKERAKYQAIAAVNAARLGRWPEARRFAWQASRTQPMRLRNHARSAVMTYRSAYERVTHEAH
jgi:rhamnopyranosyl-N-acetylglucosaminyl-diphospho-decaprenol beta-1,3/1,4-galactofuranosyltransferase